MHLAKLLHAHNDEFVRTMHLHRAPEPAPVDDPPLPNEHPAPQQDPVPSPHPERRAH